MGARLAVGVRFGRLTLVGRTVFTKKSRWMVLCDCGTLKDVSGDSLLTGNSNSCGCLRRELLSMWGTTHGGSKTPLYRVWASMVDRCYSETTPGYSDYGGRGITVCERWHDFANFRDDIGKRPSPRHSLDRINNDLGYSPDNVRWATGSEQARNKRSNRLITYQGRTQCLQAWADELGMNRHTLATRIDRQGLDIAEAFTRPSRYRNK